MSPDLLHPELTFRYSRSSGSGGQHVNKVATQVELLFSVAESELLTKAQKMRINQHLASRIDQQGILHLRCSETRSQHRNRQLVINRFDELISEALRPKRKRKGPPTFTADRQARLKAKKRQAEKKAARRRIDW
ncbi:MAG: alternative ribosome rescue aminoacyl-tRNA hydrolase ArfB [Bacteroidota bacterium]